ncbi:peptidoglycan biosynthesis protein MviN [Aldersonia sp. NBC_00410]|uniref:lipid II flippase MurJ n=1 Tax=Aldersonia sp. NBC_00410 TaxID=2975954 RepID=UPI00225743EA|nr:lipid II flippase MurJ [Aldersonia sp. NBC_00410]MCX5044999.1 peptidoglycan biosynthesis protein MviN [Aldersonia sp. NBC_00410]
MTGFLKQLLLLTVLGGAVASSFTVASQIPNMIAELVLGAVLTAIVVPVLVRAEREDPDGGAAFVRRLFTAALTLLAVAALLATAAAPLLTTHVYLSSDGKVDTSLTTALSFLLLPAILFYGLSALLTAILNTRQVFKPGAWAPVLNNVVVLAVLGIYLTMPGEISLDPVRMSDPKLLVLGLGVLAGVITQALSLLPAIRRAGISLRPLWGFDARLRQFGGMAVAIVLYVLISQLGFVFATRVSSHADAAGPAIYNNAWLLLQLPYGVLGVTVLTAIMPRLSRNAAAEDTPAVVDDLSVATRLTMLTLVPVVTFLTLCGTQVGQALYGYGNFGSADAERLGHAVSWSAFTLIPYALVLIHLRVFYAREQAWTPTWIIIGITAVKIALSALAPVVATNDDQVVSLLGVANGISFAVGAAIGGYLLHRSLGNLQMANVGKTVWLVLVASIVGGALMLVVDRLIGLEVLSEQLHGPGSALRVAFDGILMLSVTFAILRVARVPEVVAVTVAIERRFLRRGRDDEAGAPTDAVSDTDEFAAYARSRAYDPFMDAETMVLPVFGTGASMPSRDRGFPYPVRQDSSHAGPHGRGWSATREGARVSDDANSGGSAGNSDSDATANASTDIMATGRGSGPSNTGRGSGPSNTGRGSGPSSTGRADDPAPQGQADQRQRPADPRRQQSADPRRQQSADPRRGDPLTDTGSIPVSSPAMPPVRVPGGRAALPPRGPKLVPGASVAGGRYRLLAPHGGARGLRFWQAHDTKLDRAVALTFVDAEQKSGHNQGNDGPQAILSRTLRLGRINSPGLARVLDVVRGSSGGIVVAEWTPGRSLREMAETSPSPIGAARAVHTLAAAAEFAHRSGGALSIDHPDRIRISAAGDAVLAFPATLADSTAPSDVRGLGAALYALITDRWPIEQAQAVTGTAAPPAPSTIGGLRQAERSADGNPVEPREVRPEVPFEISAVAMRALATNRGVSTAATVAHVLEQASVVDQKTDLIPALRLGQRPAGAKTGHTLADPAGTEDQGPSSRLLLVLAGLGLLAVLILGLIGWWLANTLTGGGSSDTFDDNALGLTTSATAPAPAGGAPAAGETSPPSGVPVPASEVSVFSPQGTPDSPATARLTLDNNAATVWRTDTYFQQFPTLKSGVGLVATLPTASKLSGVWINSPTPGTKVEVRSAPSRSPTLDQTQVIGTATLGNGLTQIPVDSGQPTRYVLVWITSLASSGGQFQSGIADMGFTATS